jgi:hypothetical protein
MLPGRAEHFVAYAGTGLFFVIGLLNPDDAAHQNGMMLPTKTE